jgi:outer membrane biosynthesis protein TonB
VLSWLLPIAPKPTPALSIHVSSHPLVFISWLTIFCNILSRQPTPSPQEPNVVEIEQEDSFPNQALNYLSEIEKTEVLADSSKDDKKSPSSKDDSKPAPKPTPKPKPSKDRDAPTPTRKPKPTPKPTKRVRSNPTRKPTRKPSGSRSSSSLIRQNWSRDECSSKNLSKRCKELNDTVCSQKRSSLSSNERAVCIRVGLLKSEDLYSFDQVRLMMFGSVIYYIDR